MKKLTFILFLTIAFIASNNAVAQEKIAKPIKEFTNSDEKLIVVWTSGDLDVALKMVYMYTYNAKKRNWWNDVTFVIWGPSSKLLSENKELQDYLKKMQDEGIVTEACKACADMYGVSEKLKKLDIDVKYMGTTLTKYIKSDSHVITF